MPQKRITFIVIPANDGPVREYCLPSWALWTFALTSFLLVSALGYYARGYHRKVDQEETLVHLRDENLVLLRSMELTRKEVAHLEEAIGVLADDDERLRAYHMMEPLSEEMRLGGVGGPEEDLPDDDFMALPAGKRQMIQELDTRIARLQREARLQEESFKQIERKFLETEGDLKHFPTISPVPRDRAWISSGFGHRIDPFTGRKAFHSGIDFAGRTGTPIMATADGVVTYAYYDLRLGNVIVVEHSVEEIDPSGQSYTRPGTYRTEYGHLDKLLVKKGERVQRRQIIGTMGNTGRSTGPHLHYAVRYQDHRQGRYKGYVDPKDFLLDQVQRDADAQAAQVSGWLRAEE